MKPNSDDPAWYALRRTMPTWSFEANLQELIEFLPQYRIDELIVKVDVEDFFHGQPMVDWVKDYQPNLFKAKETLEKIGVVYSLNPWFTLGHCDRGRDSRKHLPGLGTMVGHDGTECQTCACPLDPVWREMMDEVWTIYAETEPHIIWVEDDIRTFNHSPVKYGCFCERHMAFFAEKLGESVSREELVKAILQPGKPHPWRKLWLDLQGEVMVETASFISSIVHRTSPNTSIGLMSSGARNHCLEGRDWNKFCEALSGGRTLYSRPPLGNYHEDSLRGLYYSPDSIKLTRHVMPDATVEQTEVENVHFTNYSNSCNFTFLKMAISFAYGSLAVTMNLFDHLGSPMEINSQVGKKLAEKKPFLIALAKEAQKEGQFRGVGLLHHPESSYHKKLEDDAVYRDLAEDGYHCMEMLESLGIPTTYSKSGVTATSGQLLRSYSDDEIRELLAGNLMIDGEAAAVLLERGFGNEIGLQKIHGERSVNCSDLGPVGAEECFNPDFGGDEKVFMTSLIPDLSGAALIYKADLKPAAQEICRLVDQDTKPICPSMYAYENGHGGRIVVLLWKLRTAYGTHFRSPRRVGLLQAAVKWLSNDTPQVLVSGDGVFPMSFRHDYSDGSGALLGFFNLSLDPWTYIEWQINTTKCVTTAEFLTTDGNWHKTDQLVVEQQCKSWKVKLTGSVGYDTPAFIRLGFE